MKSQIFIIYLFIACLFCSCITNRQKNYLQKESSPAYAMVEFQPYKLCVNDEIAYFLMTSAKISQAYYNSGGIYGGITNVTSYRIYEDGCIVLPTIGKVEIVGMTIEQAQQIITEKFKTIIVDAEVKIALVNNYFYVQGDFGKGQFYMYKDNLTIFQALAMAGDMSNMADKKHIKIIRKGTNGFDQIHTIDIRKESILESEFYYIKPNDVIYIPTQSRSFFRIDSITSFMSTIISPISLLVTLLLYFK